MAVESKLKLLARVRELSDTGSLLHLALNDALNGEITWFRRGRHSIGISRPTSASGGLAIHRYFPDGAHQPHASVYYAEGWFNDVLRVSSTVPYDADTINFRNAVIEAKYFLQDEQAKFYSTKIAESHGITAPEETAAAPA